MPLLPLPTRLCSRVARGLVLGAIALTTAHATLAAPAIPGSAAPAAGPQHRVRAVAAASAYVLLLAGDADGPAGTTTWAQRSVDGGRTWSAALAPRLAGHAIVSVVAVDDQLRVLTQEQGATAGAVFLLESDDAGASWSFVGEVTRPSPDATAVAQRWSDFAHGTVTLRWQQAGAGCREGSWTTANVGETWTPAGAPTACAVARPVCSASVDGATWRWARCGDPLETAKLKRRRGARVDELAVTAVDSGNVYAALHAGAEGVVVGTGERLRLRQAMLARLEPQADGTLHVRVGGVDGVEDCAGGGGDPGLAVTLAVGADALAPVVGEPAKLDDGDGSALLLAPGALLTRRPDGALVHRFASRPLGAPFVEVALPAGSVRVADRFVAPGPAPESAGPIPASAGRVIMKGWGASTLLGQRVVPAEGGRRGGSDGFITLGPWEYVYLDGRRAWVVDRCATAAVALVDDATTDANGGALGARWGGGDDGASIAPGTPLSTERGAAIGVTTARQSEPAEHFGLGGGGAPRVKSLPDGRRCGALAAGWLERDDGSPWFVCWRGAGG